MKNIIRIYNLTVRFSKFTLNIEIYKEFVEFVRRKILFLLNLFKRVHIVIPWIETIDVANGFMPCHRLYVIKVT